MRKLSVLLFSLVLLANACASDDDAGAAVASTDDNPTAGPDTGDTDTAADTPAHDDTEDTTTSADTEPSGAEAIPAGVRATDCGFDGDLQADRIEIAQIPGDGREDNPSALRDLTNPGFGEPLVDLNRILRGGPPPDGIPPIDNPIFQTASTVDWIECNEPVLSLSVNGEARAYPVQIMTWHELVNDTFGEEPVTISYCPLCNSSLAYRRDLGDRVVTFGTSGSLFNSSLVMYDRETESLWTHFNGAAVAGELVGTELELLPMQTTSWASFLQANPSSLVLTRETGFDRRYGDNPYAGYDDVTTSPFALDLASDPRLPAKQRIVGIRRGDESVAVVLDSVASAGVLETEVGGDVLSVWHLPGTATALERSSIAAGRDVGSFGVYLPVASGDALTFSRTDDGAFTDAETGSIWNIQGLAVEGDLAGIQLQPVEHLDTFWFALAAFEPDTRIVN